ncbi:peptidase domain-containing ABC transporter [Asticcacaulis taihuensis]|uniref:peptidase domain-containing ABC transporter n=1 Tax=Asticcacaulis taihuensis TaxID=260084 RepID=UPI003F7C74F6
MNIPDELLFRQTRRLPVVLSSESAECGLVCLTMIAQYHGHDVDLNGLRQKFAISMSGASLRGLMSIADELNFSSRALRAELGALDQIMLPAILHWDFNHYVVLKSVSRGRVVIHDPSRGRSELGLDEVSKHFTGVVLELSPSEPFEVLEAKAPVSLNNLWSSLRGFKQSLAFVLLLSFALQICAFLLPFQMQIILDDVIGQNDVDLLSVVALGFTLLIILQVVLEALRAWTLQLFGSQIIFQIAGNVFRHLIRLPSSYFEKRHVGDIVSRMGAIRNIQTALTQGLVTSILDGLMALVAGIILFIYAPFLATIVLVSILIVTLLTIGFYPIIKARNEEAIVAGANEQSHVMESIRAATTIKLMGQESVRENAWRNIYGKSFNSNMSAARAEQILNFLKQIILTMQVMLIIYLGTRNILTAEGFSVGMLVAFLAFRQTFTDRANSLVQQGLQFGMLKLYVERLGDIITQEVEAKPGTIIPIQASGEILIKNVSFRYGSTDRMVLQNINLEINSGDFITIIGPTGGGKSTLMKLLLGLQVPTHGTIHLDGQLAGPDLWRAWRVKTGVVMQDDRLISGSLADNIAFFDPDMNMERVIEAAKQAQVHEDITCMPMAYQTLVGDMGSSLSGGQKQRVLLARALYRKPKILLLDEGTANLDPATEEIIADMLTDLGITRIVIAHRPALIERSNRVVRIIGGGIEIVR